MMRNAVTAGLVAATCAVVAVSQQPDQAGAATPTIRVVENRYKVHGRTAKALKQEMLRIGPKGFWAYTEWHIRWSSDCQISLTINYTFPEMADRAKVPLPLRTRWDDMMTHLVEHEEKHGQHGRLAVKEMTNSQCKDGKAIIKKWSAEGKAYDARTEHGASEGVLLPD